MTVFKGTTDVTSAGTDSGTIAPVSQRASAAGAVMNGGNLLPRGTVNQMNAQPLNTGGIPLYCPSAGAPYQGPGFRVPAGATVRVRAMPGNTGNILLALLPEDLRNGQCDVLAPNTEIIWPVDNLAKLWASSTAGGNDGAVISVRSA